MMANEWTYAVEYRSEKQELIIKANLPSNKNLLTSPAGREFVSDVKFEGKGIVHYRFQLGEAAKALKDNDSIRSMNNIFLTNPALWLLHPEQLPKDQKVLLSLSADAGSSVGSGLFPSEKDPKIYQTTADHLDDMPLTIFGPYHHRSFTAGGSSIDLAIIPAAYKVNEEQIIDWAKRATSSVTSFYGRFPVPHILVVVVSREFYNGPGKSYGDGGAVTINPLSLKADDSDLRLDWVMTHEIVHLAFPGVDYKHHWLEEGLATYVEPLARQRSGELKAETVFKGMIEGMPNGLVNKNSGGLDGTRDWGRIYWGGALYCLLVDTELRERSKGKVGIEVALRAIVDAGGTMAVQWPLEKALAIGDKATGYPVMNKVYQEMKDKWVDVDLKHLWKSMGVALKADGSVTFDDKAPLAYVREGMIKR
ncbi:MAG: hypothetical protein EOP04_16110 [Proteobacteria bacterium]|nr:MAG: hypothetical protein EOP04_16110 [Pseudomonadota bacterium]